MECSSFQAELVSQDRKDIEVLDFTLDSKPSTFLDIKKGIEKSFSIPVCVQLLVFQAFKVLDMDNPELCYIRSGDTFTVHYPAKGDCDRVLKAVDWLNKLADTFSNMKSNFKNRDVLRGLNADYKRLVSMEYADVVQDLCSSMSVPWSNKTKQVNKAYFDSLGGVKLLMSVYKSVVDARLSSKELRNGLYLENVFCLFVTNYTQTLPLTRCVFQHGGLELCMKSFLYSSVTSKLDSLPVRVVKIIADALNALSSLSELPECQRILAQDNEVLERALHVAKSSLFTYETARNSMFCLESIVGCSEAHTFLMRPDILNGLLEVCEIRRTQVQESNRDIAAVALESCTSSLMAQMILRSSQHLLSVPETLQKRVLTLMQSVYSASPSNIAAYEMSEGLDYTTFFPYVLSLYYPTKLPPTEDHGSSLLVKLVEASKKVLAHTLNVALRRESNVQLLIEEGLMDYLMALAWFLPENSTRDLLKDCIFNISKFTLIQPLSLCTLTKAKLAKDSLGLKKVMDIVSISDVLFYLRDSGV